jgi:DNA-directed RNA polymerase III subunit RPC11
MRFCPNCGSLLRIRKNNNTGEGCMFVCKNCFYQYEVPCDDGNTVRDELEFKPKVREEVIEEKIGGAITTITCPKCTHDKATFHQQQTRSGDEASTIFYTCVKCKHTWTEN